MVENTCPILRVENLDRSLDYYLRVLGFKVNWQDADSAGISRDNGHLMLILQCQGAPGTYVWMGVQDVRAFREEVAARGAKIRHEPQNYPWALEMKIEDPDGHVLRVGSNPIEGQPFDDFTL